ncbi:TonB-dependent receptor [Asticcacaulis sp. ZE23SCel15]|uniref:TonB-dependent receptor n=1 Tax=Asticcacaulis sp. ZE23SCel15 TaxID=3059027 RepID=UPI00265EECE2|nr:TonB-dependent receptor [Asticcacaulis sp. ZE23SCel15]WKL58085.1 TonB-dependent receptor [Asticcacaulis sp. ZE23SCel15]
MPAKITHATGVPKIYRARIRFGASLAVLMAASLGTAAFAQDTAPADDVETVVVTGFRGSLQSAISEKKRSVDMVDVIKAEDIGQFPDLNLAESLQRIPGVSIDRDGGEGKQITVRGLNSEFSRTRLNGLEALATTGSKDSSGGTNRGRGFDFNVFAADLFNSITVRKSLSAEIEEGSLGATVDLQTARPFDYKGFTMAVGGQVGYNDLAKETAPRGTFMISNRWADGKLGALLSVAYGERTVIEDSTNTTRWENAYSASNVGRFESFSTNGSTTFTNIAPCTANVTNRNCNTTEVNAQNPTLTGEAQAISRALHPRIPRYNHFETDQKRLGITGAFQMRPWEGTLVTIDAMHAEFQSNRDEWEIEAISFSRNNQGLPRTDVYNYEIDDQGTLVKGSFNDVDIRSEHRYDELTTTFDQLNFTWDQNWGERFSSKLLIGASESFQDNPEQTTFTFESYNVDGYSYDYTDMTAPKFNYGTSSTGCTPDQACYWTYSSSTALGDASLIRIRPQTVRNEFSTARLDLKYDLNEHFTIKGGFSDKSYKFNSTEYGRISNLATPQTRDENAAGLIQTTINADIAKFAQTVTVAGTSYLIPNLDLIRSTFNYDCRCGTATGNTYGNFYVNNTNSSSRTNNRNAREDDKAWYVQVDFSGDIAGVPVRGNIGTREVETNLTAVGYVGSGNNAILTTVKRSYEDSLPAVNVSVEPIENVFLRFAAAKTMARPTLLSLTPGGGSISTTAFTITTGNPDLDPVRANTMDFSLEWYPDKDTLVSLAVFKKELKSYIQTVQTSKTLSELGYDPADLGVTGDPSFTVTTPINTAGGDLTGWEFSVQKPFTFLPGILSRTGGIFNYTNVESQIDYYTSPTATTTTRANLLGLSPKAWNTTLYYEGPAVSARVAFAYRDGYLSQLNPGSSADFWGKNETFNIDAQMTWEVTKNLTFILEGINLTDEADDRYIAYNTAQGNTAQNLLYDYGTSGRQYYLGVRYKY